MVRLAVAVGRSDRGPRVLPRTRSGLLLVVDLVVIVGIAGGFPMEPNPGCWCCAWCSMGVNAGIIAGDDGRGRRAVRGRRRNGERRRAKGSQMGRREEGADVELVILGARG